MNFIAIDFETANQYRYSPCSLALTVVQNNQIVDKFYSLIKPDVDFNYRNTLIHGITAKDVANAPTFPELWQNIKIFFQPQNLIIAHNAVFDNSVIKQTLAHYFMPSAHYLTLDTKNTTKKLIPNLTNYKLDTISDYLNITLEHHHNALDDSIACAKILLTELNLFDELTINQFIKSI